MLGGLGDHGVACCQRGDGFAGEDGEWEVPRADGNHHAFAAGVVGEGVLGFVGVVAAEIYGFAHFGDGVG